MALLEVEVHVKYGGGRPCRLPGDHSGSPDSLFVNERYEAASRRASTSEGSERSRTIIHPSPYGSSFTSSGASINVPLRSLTVPLTGANTSETDLVDSTSPKGSPPDTSVPTSGMSTYTTSPRASWAKSVMPTRTNPSPSILAHSCCSVYRRSSGYSIDPSMARCDDGLGERYLGGPGVCEEPVPRWPPNRMATGDPGLETPAP